MTKEQQAEITDELIMVVPDEVKARIEQNVTRLLCTIRDEILAEIPPNSGPNDGFASARAFRLGLEKAADIINGKLK